jgi:nicotinamide-nucleotide amidase
MEEIIKKLILKNKTISCMESCTGGMLASEITNIDGASNVFSLGIVSYSNEQKINFGINKKNIEKFTVYSKEIAIEMAKKITKMANSNFGIGITGKLGTEDLKNPKSDNNTVYISIYNKDLNKDYNYILNPIGINKYEKKCYVINFVKQQLKLII